MSSFLRDKNRHEKKIKPIQAVEIEITDNQQNSWKQPEFTESGLHRRKMIKQGTDKNPNDDVKRLTNPQRELVISIKRRQLLYFNHVKILIANFITFMSSL